MSEGNAQATGVLLRKLEQVLHLTDLEQAAIADLKFNVVDVPPHVPVAREGARPGHCCLVVKGMTCWAKFTSAGKRQISSLAIPGDIPDLHSLHLRKLDSDLVTITACQIGLVQHEALHDLCLRFPNIASALWRMTLIDGAIFREWVTNIGSRPAYSRIAHLLCEMYIRNKAVGLANENSCRLPLTQTEIGECTGLSTVHINRNLQNLRAARFISFETNVLGVVNWDRLAEVGDFDPTYLHLQQE